MNHFADSWTRPRSRGRKVAGLRLPRTPPGHRFAASARKGAIVNVDYEHVSKEQLARWYENAKAEAKAYRVGKAYWKNYALALEKQLGKTLESDVAH